MDSEILTKLTLLFVAIAQLFMVLICIFALRRYQDLVSVIFDKLELLEDIIQKDNSTLGFFDSTSKSIDSKSEKKSSCLSSLCEEATKSIDSEFQSKTTSAQIETQQEFLRSFR